MMCCDDTYAKQYHIIVDIHSLTVSSWAVASKQSPHSLNETVLVIYLISPHGIISDSNYASLINVY